MKGQRKKQIWSHLKVGEMYPSPACSWAGMNSSAATACRELTQPALLVAEEQRGGHPREGAESLQKLGMTNSKDPLGKGNRCEGSVSLTAPPVTGLLLQPLKPLFLAAFTAGKCLQQEALALECPPLHICALQSTAQPCSPDSSPHSFAVRWISDCRRLSGVSNFVVVALGI